MTDEKLKHIVRIANTDLPGNKAVSVALTKIRGMSYMFAHMVCRMADVDINKKAGYLNSREIEMMNDVIQNQDKFNVPSWMKNRRKDFETGKDRHILTGDLQFIQEQDIRRMKKIKSYKGSRHSAGLPARGQRTKGNFRRNKGKAVGVKRKSGAKSGRV